MKKVIKLITFSDGNDEFRSAGVRLGEQANETGWFSDVEVFNASKLSNLSTIWYNQNINFLTENHRGFGYWLWKPFIISENLKKIPKNTFLIYADAGYEINHHGYDRFNNYIDLANDFDFLGFSINENLNKWTKGDLIEYFGISSDSPVLNANMRQAGLMIIKATLKNISFMNAWLEICNSRFCTLLDDTPSFSKNCSDYVEHRHDQSVFTLLSLVNNFGYFIPAEDYYPDLFSRGQYPEDKPFICLRNKTGIRLIR